MARFLISGTRSGLGRYLHRRLGGDEVRRETDVAALSGPYDAILHCAATADARIARNDPGRFHDDNVTLTARLLQVPHRHFVFLSSVDVYPPGEAPKREDARIELERAVGPYADAKLAAEELVTRCAAGPLILRPVSLVGRDARASNLMRLIGEARPRLTVSADARYNAVLHRDVGDFIEACLGDGVGGVFNLASTEAATVKNIAAHLGHMPAFGDFRYDVGAVDNTKAREILPALRGSTLDTIDRYRKVDDR